ncbi:hypothetical protein [Akkermansia glycaniphila]|uniref:Uncharacterized protein n=1 Tax=Akkermansia glycaniphila TaxID=1679444 RepID=A0A1H6LG57_9BACT|nr:hypothetical protein [Akkermansia glycaniphila]SEH83517.1 Hypothetical protein PYTT_1097 [Akkermansia glycaniphila]
MKKIFANEELEYHLANLNIDLLPLIARCSIWAPKELHESCLTKNGCAAKSPMIRRKRSNEKRGSTDIGGFRLDDNTYPNSQMKQCLKRYYGLDAEGYETCHIWNGTCYDARYHTAYANLVLLPRAIASLSDHNLLIQQTLRYRSFELYQWKPDEEKIPLKPNGYPKEWRDLPTIFSKSANKYTPSLNNHSCDISIGLLAREHLTQFFNKQRTPIHLLNSLLKPGSLAQQFSGHSRTLPVLSEIRSPKERFYANPLEINGKYYYLTNDWYEHQRNALIKWLRKLGYDI